VRGRRQGSFRAHASSAARSIVEAIEVWYMTDVDVIHWIIHTSPVRKISAQSGSEIGQISRCDANHMANMRPLAR